MKTAARFFVIALLICCGFLMLTEPLSAGKLEELKIGINAIPRTLEPYFDTASQAEAVQRLMFDRLVDRDENGKPIPWLAKSWRPINDKTWEFRLREDVRWHNGDQFTADDVKYCLEFVKDPKNKASKMGFLKPIEKIEIVDKYTINIHTKEKWAGILQSLMLINIIPNGYWEKPDKFKPAENPIGTGRYKFVKWAVDNFLTLEANPDSWAGKTTIPRVTYRHMPEAVTRLAALETGEIHIAYSIAPEHVSGLKKKGFAVGYTPIGQTCAVNMAGSRAKIFADKRVRQAINYAIDKKAIIDNILLGYGRLLNGQIVGPDGFGYDPTLKPYPYDPDKAKKLLAEAGYPNGFTVNFDGCNGRYPKDKEICEAIAAMLSNVGIKVDLHILESSVWAQKWYSNTIGPMFMSGWMYMPMMDVVRPFGFLQCHPKSKYNIYCNPEFDELFAQSIKEFDQQKRLKILHKMAAIFREDATIIFLHQIPALFGIDSRLKNVKFLPDLSLDFYNASYESK